MRVIETHKVNGCNEALTITVKGTVGPGGANHVYIIDGFSPMDNPEGYIIQSDEPCAILFQNGPIPENGTNGVTQEALLAIVIDRLESFQKGPFACFENKLALDHCELALGFLKERTAKRVARGVEGTHKA